MKKKILHGLYFCMYYLGIVRLFYWITRNKNRILVYHHVIDDAHWDNKLHLKVAIKKSLFLKQLNIISRRIGFAKYYGDKGCLITFDDGYSCAFNAVECLNGFNAKGYFFCPINNIEKEEPLWIDKILLWFSYVPNGEYNIFDNKIFISTDCERETNCNNIINLLYSNYDIISVLSELNRNYSFESLIAGINDNYFRSRFIGLSSDDLVEIKRDGHFIGAHSVNHDILSQLNTNSLEHDFDICQKGIDNYFNTKLYAYPFGHLKQVDERVYSIMAKSKFSHGLMNEKIKDPKLWSLSRLSISAYSNRYEIEANLSGLSDFIRKIFNNGRY